MNRMWSGTPISAEDLEITDHALLRWLERIHGIDVEGFRTLMRNDVAKALDAYQGTRSLDQPAFMLIDRRIVTVLPSGQKRPRRKKDRDSIPIPLAEASGTLQA